MVGPIFEFILKGLKKLVKQCAELWNEYVGYYVHSMALECSLLGWAENFSTSRK